MDTIELGIVKSNFKFSWTYLADGLCGYGNFGPDQLAIADGRESSDFGGSQVDAWDDELPALCAGANSIRYAWIGFGVNVFDQCYVRCSGDFRSIFDVQWAVVVFDPVRLWSPFSAARLATQIYPSCLDFG